MPAPNPAGHPYTQRGHRGRAGDPLYSARRTLHTGTGLLTDRQRERLTALLAADAHVEVEATWGVYQRISGAYREPDPARGRQFMVAVIDSLKGGVPAPLRELTKFGRTLKQRAEDVLAYVDRLGTSNGPTEAINSRLEHLRGSALGSATSPTTSLGACSRPVASVLGDSALGTVTTPTSRARDLS